MKERKIVRDIKGLKIQGAHNVAKSALVALKEHMHSSHADTKIQLIAELGKLRTVLEQSRPTEPMLRNVLKYVYEHSAGQGLRDLRESFFHSIQRTLIDIEEAEKTVHRMGMQKIRNGMVVFTHCHSSTVMGILQAAKMDKIKFEVHNTETRPHLQGRLTAEELARMGIKVTHYVDSAARLALKKADIMLIGCDCFTSEGKVINKIGSELFAEVASKRDIPIYVCTTTWKFDPKTVFGFEEVIEERLRQEIWPRAPKNVCIDNHAFEQVDPNLVTGMITEFGIYKPQVLVEELRQRSPWMFN